MDSLRKHRRKAVVAPSKPNPAEVTHTYARIPPAICLASGLFVSKSKAPRLATTSIAVLAEQEIGELVYVFEGPGPLGTEDLRTLQAVFMLASHPSNRIEMNAANPATPIGNALVGLLALSFEQGAPTIAKMATGNPSSLAAAGGYTESGGGSRSGITDSLKRLAEIVVICLRNGAEVSRSKLLATTPLDPDMDHMGEPKDKFAIALAPSLSTTLIGSGNGRYGLIEQQDIDRLSEAGVNGSRTRLLHMRLCGFIDPGRSRQVSTATLAEYAFGKTESKDTVRRQYGDIRSSMPVLQQLGWTVSADDKVGGKQVFTISRPALPARAKKSAPKPKA